MTTHPTPEDSAQDGKRRRGGIFAFFVGAAVSLAFFAFFPGLPHVIDWGAILVSLAVGVLARLAYRAWVATSGPPSP
ncbi:hypothetical protein DEJ50_17755 [Streptomyces venezuelae]|uniref:Uncharacterized protein n=1 Tax=Streptomyces venezuelae TaxID=54571 RepID=A0A5P2D5L8_STRVZ|nr:hypothetical protein [Streptomyces venezuelae]QES49378.1 hypothetical protein DEJ50_17755 [Streptomyces venezuelae]